MGNDNSLNIFFEVMEIGFNPKETKGLDLLFKYNISGPRGGQWYLKVKDGKLSIYSVRDNGEGFLLSSVSSANMADRYGPKVR